MDFSTIDPTFLLGVVPSNAKKEKEGETRNHEKKGRRQNKAPTENLDMAQSGKRRKKRTTSGRQDWSGIKTARSRRERGIYPSSRTVQEEREAEG